MNDTDRKIAFLEARLTLLERKFAHFRPDLDETAALSDSPAPALTTLACDDPGTMIYQMYTVETDDTGRSFCWVGNDGPIQFVLPVCPNHPLMCRLLLKPHPKVDFTDITVVANDQKQAKTVVNLGDGMLELCFNVAASFAPNINVLLLGVNSVRPADLGENDDERLLAARFFGARISPL